MIRNKITLQVFIALAYLSITLVACSQKEPEPISQATPIPEGVEVVSIDEGQVVTSEISQQKKFNQCESASSFKAEIRFSQSSEQESQNDLIFKGNVGGEIGLSEIAKVQLGSAIEKRLTNINTSGQAHDESVVIEVPAYTKQEYTIIWQEIRRDGKVEYIEGGETHIASYSYRVGVEFSSSTVIDLECSGKETPRITTPTPMPTYTPYPTYTHSAQTEPTTPPLPTATDGPVATPQMNDLAVGQYYSQGSISLALSEVEFKNTPAIWLSFNARNIGSNTISFEYGSHNILVRDNLGNTYTPHYDSFSDTKILEPGDSRSIYIPNLGNWRYYGNYADPNVTYLTVTVTGLSAIEHAEWKIPVHH